MNRGITQCHCESDAKQSLVCYARLLAGCAIGPNYKKPSVDVPGAYRGISPDSSIGSASIGEQKWWEVFQDSKLQDLIHTALQQNYDVRIAADRILEAQAQLTITSSYELPTITAGTGIIGERIERMPLSNPYELGLRLRGVHRGRLPRKAHQLPGRHPRAVRPRLFAGAPRPCGARGAAQGSPPGWRSTMPPMDRPWKAATAPSATNFTRG